MAEPIDREIEAIRNVLAALSPLSEQARASVLEYVTKRLNGTVLSEARQVVATTTALKGEEVPSPAPGGPVHIKKLKEQRKPRSANEMAALVGYYLATLAPIDERKRTINRKDIETYFKIAEFPLPKQIPMTLTNAKMAGYFDALGDGEYKLNAVGHNLVVHSMPRGSSGGATTTRRASKSKRKKK